MDIVFKKENGRMSMSVKRLLGIIIVSVVGIAYAYAYQCSTTDTSACKDAISEEYPCFELTDLKKHVRSEGQLMNRCIGATVGSTECKFTTDIECVQEVWKEYWNATFDHYYVTNVMTQSIESGSFCSEGS